MSARSRMVGPGRAPVERRDHGGRALAELDLEREPVERLEDRLLGRGQLEAELGILVKTAAQRHCFGQQVTRLVEQMVSHARIIPPSDANRNRPSAQTTSDEAISEIDLLAMAQMPVSLFPRARGEIALETRERRVDLLRVETRQARDPGPHLGIEVRRGSPPVRSVETVGAVVRDGNDSTAASPITASTSASAASPRSCRE